MPSPLGLRTTLATRLAGGGGRFTLDRAHFGAAVLEEHGSLVGMHGLWEVDLAAALAERFHDALEAGAIAGPPGVEVIVYALDDSLIVAVREAELPRDLRRAQRQLASYSFEAKYAFDRSDGSFEESCAAIEDLLTRANALLPSFAVLRFGERVLGDGWRRRLTGPFRRLAAALR